MRGMDVCCSVYVSLAEWGGSSAASHLPVAAWPAGAIVGDGLCGGAKQGRGGTAAFKLPVTRKASNEGSRRFHNHREGPETWQKCHMNFASVSQ